MRKEITIAIFLGLGIGLLAVFGIFTARSALTRFELEKQTNNGATDTISPSPGVTGTPSLNTPVMTIAEPMDGTVASENVIAVAGKSVPASQIVISAETKQFIIETDSEGSFRQDVDLVSGENEIRLTAFFQGGERQDERITIVYTTADF